jgi:lipooligosaccharide transport system permease protein
MSAPGAIRYFEGMAVFYRRTWRSSVISSFLNPMMYLAAMGLGLGSLIDAGSGGVDGVTYLAFLAPGLVAATTMQSAAGDSSWPVMAGIKWQKTYDAALATPMTVRDVVRGHLLYVIARSLLIGTVFVGISILFDAMTPGRGFVAVLPAILTGLAFGSLVMAFTARLERDTGLSNLFRFGIVPMFLFSGTFFPITQLPGWIQPLAYVTPLWHGVDLARAIALDLDTTFAWWVHIGYLAAMAGIGLVLAERFLTRRLVS